MCKEKKLSTPVNVMNQNEDDESDSDDSGSDVSLTSDSDSDSDDEDIVDTTTGNDTETKNEEEDEEEDEVVKAIRKERQNIRELPKDIVCEDYVVQISFHPQDNIIGLATMTGDVLLYKYEDDKEAELVNTVEVHTKACRDIEFNEDGTKLFSVSKDKSMMVSDVQTGKLLQAFEDAHSDPLFCMRIINENQVATGDDSGTVKLWDLRLQQEVFALREVNDFISSMITTDAQRHLVCTSGEGALTVLNLNARKLHMQSEMYEVDLNCMGLCRNDSKLVVGTSNGKLLIFKWGEFGYHNAEFPGPKHGINRLLAATDHIVITACDDGNLRATYLYPNRHLGIIGQHPFAVEALDISGDGRLIASCSHDQTVKFWNIKYLEDVEINDRVKADKAQRRHNLPSSKFKNSLDFFQGLNAPD